MPSITEALQQHMQTVEIKSYRALAAKAGVSRWQIQQLRTGNIESMRVSALRSIGNALNLSLTRLLQDFSEDFSEDSSAGPSPSLSPTPSMSPTALPTAADTAHTVQAQALQTLETWLTQWPTIAKRAQAHPDLAAAKLLPFIRPVEQLIQEWGVDPIATIDEQVPYDPTRHQLTKGTAQPGDRVQVTHTGHTHHGKLLHRAKVKPLL